MNCEKSSVSYEHRRGFSSQPPPQKYYMEKKFLDVIKNVIVT